MTQLTPEKRAIQSAVFELWKTYQDDMTQEERNQKAQDFIDVHLIEPKFDVQDAFIRHPMIGRKRHLRRVTVFDVLGDYVLNTSYKTEKDKEYPVPNRDQLAYAEERDSKILSIVTEGQEEREDEPLSGYEISDNKMAGAQKLS